MAKPTEVSVRQRVYDAVRRFPGIHLRELERQTGESAALCQYHLGKLREGGFVEAAEQGGYVRFFPTAKGKAASVTAKDRAWLGLLRENVPLHIVLLLLDEGPLTHGEIVARVGVAKSTTSYHLGKLAEGGIVDREPGSKKLRLVDRERTYRLLLTYRPTPTLIEAFADLWQGLYGE